MDKRKYQEYADKLTGLEKKDFSVLSYIQKDTDAYRTYYATYFFWDEAKEITPEVIQEAINKFDQNLSQIKVLKQQIRKEEDWPEYLKKMYLDSCNEAGLELIAFKESIYLEAKKYGYQVEIGDNTIKSITHTEKNTLSQDERDIYEKQVSRIQTAIYGPKISDVQKERELVTTYLSQLYNEKNQLLTEEEKTRFTTFLGEYEKDVHHERYTFKAKKTIEGTLPFEKMEKIAQDALTIQGISWYTITRKPGKTNYSVTTSRHEIDFPNKDKLPKNAILTLLEHEIAGHVVVGENNKKTLKFRGAKRWAKEEAINILNETLVQFPLEDALQVEVPPSHITTFFGENNEYKGTYDLTKIYYKLLGKSEKVAHSNALKRARRVKCYHDFGSKETNRKDVIYYRNYLELVDYLLSLNTNQERAEYYKTAYSMQVGFDDLRFWEQIKKDLDIEEEELFSPYFIGRVLFKTIEQGTGDMVRNEENDLWDFRNWSKTNALTLNQKRLLVEILENMGYEINKETNTE